MATRDCAAGFWHRSPPDLLTASGAVGFWSQGEVNDAVIRAVVSPGNRR